jgi:hypothetical protein
MLRSHDVYETTWSRQRHPLLNVQAPNGCLLRLPFFCGNAPVAAFLHCCRSEVNTIMKEFGVKVRKPANFMVPG